MPFFRKWEIDLGRTFSEDQKTNMIQSIFKTATCTKLQETNYKIISQWYRTPEILQKCFLNTSSECWRCQREQGTLLHVFWSCPRVEKFWKEVREIIQKFGELEIREDPALFLLHLSEIPRKTYRNSILCHLVNAAKACIPLRWKQTQPPTVSMWLRKVEEVNRMEDLVWTARKKREIYLEIWTPWNCYVSSSEGKKKIDTT